MSWVELYEEGVLLGWQNYRIVRDNINAIKASGAELPPELMALLNEIEQLISDRRVFVQSFNKNSTENNQATLT
jgi:hypothetical protein